MKRLLVLGVVIVLAAIASAERAEAIRVRVRGPRHTVVVRTGFPIVRPLPHVIVRAPAVAVRVAPAVYLPVVPFGAVVVAAPPPRETIIWEGGQSIDRDEEWADFTMNIDQRGTAMLLDVEGGRAKVSFAEVVFENGDTQVVDFGDKVFKPGLYTLLDFKDGRKVDHVRVVARAMSDATRLTARILK